MENIKNICDLKSGEVITVKVNDTVFSLLKLNLDRKQACENLYQSYLNNNSEESKKFDIKTFMDKYMEVYAAVENEKREVLKNVLDEQSYEFLNLAYNFNYNMDFNANLLTIFILGNKGGNNNEQ